MSALNAVFSDESAELHDEDYTDRDTYYQNEVSYSGSAPATTIVDDD